MCIVHILENLPWIFALKRYRSLFIINEDFRLLLHIGHRGYGTNTKILKLLYNILDRVDIYSEQI